MHNKMTIMYVIDDLLVGGAQNVLLTTINALNKRKFKIFVVALFGSNGLANEMESAGAEVIFLHMAHKFDLIRVLKLIKAIREKKIMLVHTHLLIANFWGRLAARLAGTKIIISTLHNYFYHRKSLNLIIERAIYPITTKIITVSEDMKKWFIREEKPDKDKFITIYNPIDLNEFPGVINCQNIKKELNIDNNYPVLGNIQPMRQKNKQQFLVHAMSQIVKVFPNVKLLMVGDGPLKNDMERLVDKLGLGKHIIFLGFRHDISEILSAIDIFVSCPIYEAFGMVILEAMAMKKPVVTTRVGGIPEVVLENETAVLVDPQNPDQLSTAIINLSQDKERSQQLGVMGRKRAEELFSSEFIVRKIEALYEELILNTA
ncbi:MAG: hypothetical protein SRB1_02451 [Desulfobacteraceae bacterium Eth-SRB1]|nr:MAG: hypothetical protein SRB1_02451 [Desulfobacteraceae bacterium Eth-SRB1]